jgi:hypothetical protein
MPSSPWRRATSSGGAPEARRRAGGDRERRHDPRPWTCARPGPGSPPRVDGRRRRPRGVPGLLRRGAGAGRTRGGRIVPASWASACRFAQGICATCGRRRPRRGGPAVPAREALAAEVAAPRPGSLRRWHDRPTLVLLGGSSRTAKTGSVSRALLGHPGLHDLSLRSGAAAGRPCDRIRKRRSFLLVAAGRMVPSFVMRWKRPGSSPSPPLPGLPRGSTVIDLRALQRSLEDAPGAGSLRRFPRSPCGSSRGGAGSPRALVEVAGADLPLAQGFGLVFRILPSPAGCPYAAPAFTRCAAVGRQVPTSRRR